MQTATISFDPFNKLSDEACQERIRVARAKLGKKAVILCHHYQRADVYQHADLTGDSLKLSRLASQTDSEYVIFCGVHFMAEVADIMTAPHQVAILPDLAAGCSMADMANLAKVERCWRELNEVLNAEEEVTPVTYINSAADLKAFCGEHGGIVCTSSNAGTIAKWAFERRPKVLVFPDQHLGRWTGHNMGIPMDEMVVWDPDLELGGLTPAQIKKARILLWKGHCSVHQMFQKSNIDAFRAKYPDGLVISRWLVGTELNLVDRLAREVLPQNKIVQFMATTICMCSTMQRIDPQHLAWTLENLVDGKVVNQIKVPAHEAVLAKLALDRMLAIS